MEAQSFDILEEKVNRMIAVLNRLKVENQELLAQKQALATQLEERNQAYQALKNETDQLRHVKTDIDSYKENQDRIRSKVDSLLLKLKEFEDYQ